MSSSSSSPPLIANVTEHDGNFIGNRSSGDRDCMRSNSFMSLASLEPSIVVVLVVVLITVVISVSICVFLRHLNSRCLRRLSPSSSASSSISTELRRFTSSRVASETAAVSLVDSLPRFTFSSIVRRRANSSNSAASSSIVGDCAICLSKFEPLDQLRLLPLCCHAFHVDCVDKWLSSNNKCPLCRSPVHHSDSDLAKAIGALSSSSASITAESTHNSFRIEIGSISRRRDALETIEHRSSYSVGSFEYIMDDQLEVATTNAQLQHFLDKESEIPPSAQILASEVGSVSRNWLWDYIDRLSRSVSSRALSCHGSGRFFGGSNRITEDVDLDLEGNRIGEEIGEMFRWLSAE